MRFLVTTVQIPAPSEVIRSCQAANSSRRERNRDKATADIRTTNVIEPRAVRSAATSVSHGRRILATAVRMDKSRLCTSLSRSSEVIFMKTPKHKEAAPIHNDKRFSRPERLRGLSCMVNPTHTTSGAQNL